jgi:hypothetical protein
VKPVISSTEVILSRISGTLLIPGVGLRKFWLWLVEESLRRQEMVQLFVQHHLSVWRVLMTIDLDHVIVPTHNRSASASLLAELLGVSWAGAGPFCAVYVNERWTLDFIETEGFFAPHRYFFQVDEEKFNAIVGRLRKVGIKYRSTASGPDDMQINRQLGGCNIYWNEPDGHQWEIRAVNQTRQLE